MNDQVRKRNFVIPQPHEKVVGRGQKIKRTQGVEPKATRLQDLKRQGYLNHFMLPSPAPHILYCSPKFEWLYSKENQSPNV